MGALFFSVTAHEIAFGLYSDLPWIRMAYTQASYFPRLAGL